MYTHTRAYTIPSESGKSNTENWSSGIAAENLLSSVSNSVACRRKQQQWIFVGSQHLIELWNINYF